MSNAPGTPDEYEFAPMEVEAVPPPPTVYEPPAWGDGHGISYSSVSGRGRPGGLTAIGVLSVVLGSFSVLASLGFGSWQFGMLMLGRVQRSMASTMVIAAPISPPTAAPIAGPPIPSTPTPLPSGGRMLTRSEQQAIMVRILLLGGRMNPSQRLALMKQLRTPGQQLVVPTGGNTSAPENQVSAASNTPDGSLKLQTQRPNVSTTLVISPAGAITRSIATTWTGSGTSSSAWSTTSTVTTSSAAAVTPGALFGGRHLDEGAASMALSMSALNGALAIFLIVSGVLMLRNNPHAARLHRLYAVLKLPIALLAAIATGWLWSSFMSTITPPSGGANPGPIVGFIMAIPALLGLIYPAVLLGVMHSRWVHQWYGEA